MKLIFCGGAMEVGASCYLVRVAGKNILLDCGIRMTSNKDSLPDFSLIQDNGGVDAIFISHAHIDHTGALPAISRQYPNARIYMTQPTKDLVRVLLYDSLKIMEREAEIPIYTENHVIDMLDRVMCYSPHVNIKPFDDCDITATFYSAGHILGAASLYLKTPEGSIFYSGDFSGFKQNAIEGASIPRLRPDIAIIESTYGDRLHANREMEEKRLIDMVRNVISRKGNVLIPAFALGRAQEVILILRRAIAKKQLPDTEIYVDGLVKDICRVYMQNPNYLRSQLAKKVLKGNDIFFNDTIQKVTSSTMRDDIIKKDGGCIIISSSGMLTGGPSQIYAQKFAGGEKNFIAITGYQDEEAPGRQLADLAEGKVEDRVIKINDININVHCDVGKYALSAHADMMEILGLLGKLRPKSVILVHGGPDAITKLGQEVMKEFKVNVYTPQNGDDIEIQVEKPRKQVADIVYPSMKADIPLDEKNMEELWRFIYTNIGSGAALSAQDIAHIWGYEEQSLEEISDLLDKSIYFDHDRKMMFLYHALDLAAIEDRKKPRIMEVNKMLELANQYFTSEMGVYRIGARQDESCALVYFNFPDVAKNRYQDLFQKFQEETGWKVEINQNINTSAINREILKALPAGVTPVGKISYDIFRKVVEIKIDQSLGDQELKDIKERFKNGTGMDLFINHPGDAQQEVIDKSHQKTIDSKMMEQNAALNLIDQAFKDYPHRPYKKSIKSKGGTRYIELSFISKPVGERYTSLIRELEDKTGWAITISSSCNQVEILNIVTTLCEKKGIALRKNPSIYLDSMQIKIYPVEPLNSDLIESLSESLKELTGFTAIA
ncbi:RNA processing exonuclease, beta-lactamase fold, Cft2 family [Caldanaerobius fijiensis DSM 17918]|uniref:RNA processing exonuclease, beta-lactamase fold, Cft2 family n=1 Tax=Caldanaerobius fijiensis DSM 17918 TaxID=1121256 RepID=A0A1M5ASK9_9THEO|nr:MBL fold metallo-hydrolase [Caldanaerobius fijiensis]SHF33184.1 RNA processing exonuclease, beta-lactamase fold, Cft2 family [Caldanaerobius fijiensis DSM 17918]